MCKRLSISSMWLVTILHFYIVNYSLKLINKKLGVILEILYYVLKARVANFIYLLTMSYIFFYLIFHVFTYCILSKTHYYPK